MEPITVVLADGAEAVRRQIRERLSGEPDFEVVSEARGGREALELVQRLEPDLLFLDVELPDLGGLEVLERLPEGELPEVIVVTAGQEHALDAFEHRALDYLVRPLDGDRFAKALERARRQILLRREWERAREVLASIEALRTGTPQGRSTAPPEGRLRIREKGRVVFLDPADLIYVKSDGNYLELHCPGRVHLVRGTMTEIAGRLGGQPFTQIHRSIIVNLDHVEEVRPLETGSYEVVTREGSRLPLSRTYRDQLLEGTL